MRDSSSPTTAANVVWRTLFGLLLAMSLVRCDGDARPSHYQRSASLPDLEVADDCAAPRTGCACDVPGTLVDCGEVREQIGDYVTCTQGVRRCGDDRVWGACSGDLVKVSTNSRGTSGLLGLGLPQGCSDANPCDPLCRQIVDNGSAYPGLPEGLCSTGGAVALCPLCGYEGTVSQLSYTAMPLEWRRIPDSCSPADDRCPFDMVCVGSSCQSRAEPCAPTNADCAVDLTLGKACLDPSDPTHSYHIPVCNRGTQPLRGATIRIGVDSRSANLAACAPPSPQPPGEGFPDHGYIEFTLSNDEVLLPGTCVEVQSGSTVASPNLNLAGSNALLVNFDGSVAECNRCNNASVTIVNADVATSSACTTCVGDGCLSRNTTLRGVLYDPAGRNPVPNAIVYVPTGAVPPFVDGVAVDRCETTIQGETSISTVTDATGHFTLTGVPSDTAFGVVVQLGRWRRIYPVPPVPAGETRWVLQYDSDTSQLVLSPDATEPAPFALPASRLRLPATQRRCDDTTCTGEGDVPKMALLLSDADPLECALRRIGIADSEFTATSGVGRVQLFRANGMSTGDANTAFGSNGLLARSSAANTPALLDYSILIAPCNGEHRRIGVEDYASSPAASGPSYNSWPDPTASELERANVGLFVNAGGRVLTSHWLGVDFVHLNHFPPPRATLSGQLPASPIVTPYDSSADPALSAAIAAFGGTVAGFGWEYAPAISFNTNAPVLHVFGNGVNYASNVADAASSAPSGTYPPLTYSFDTSSPSGRAFAQWAAAIGVDNVTWRQWSPMVTNVRASLGGVPLLTSDTTDASRFGTGGTIPVPLPAQACLEGDGSDFDCDQGRAWGGQHVGMYRIDTPPDSPRGRIGAIAGHASHHDCYSPSNTRASKYCGNTAPYSTTNPPPDCDCLTFPGAAGVACGAATELSSEELAFEYLLFDTAQCIGVAPRKRLPPVVTSAGFFRDFEANCALGEQPIWRLFSWQAEIPEGTSINFFAGTANTQAELEAADYLQIGLANVNTTTWTASNHTIDELLRTQLTPPQPSRQWLRVWSVFVPNAGASPRLSDWRVVFNCVVNE